MNTGYAGILHHYFSNHVLTAYLLNVFVGALITFFWSYGLHMYTRSNAQRTLALPILVGLFERALIMTFVIWLPGSAGAFLGMWILVKAVGGWAKVGSGAKDDHEIYAVGLLGSLMSGTIAVAMGLLAAEWWPGSY